jgi:hypothetical protein
MLRSEVFRNYLEARRTERNADLIDRVLAHWPHLEIQVNVKNGTPVEGVANRFFDEGFEYSPIRWPRSASSDPVYFDPEQTWPPELFVSGIGSTGWDWHDRVSRWVGFDFDAITGHAKGVGVSDADLELVRAQVRILPFTEGRESTSGTGLHIYVGFEPPVPTANHTEHAVLGRAVLEHMARLIGLDLGEYVDACGGNMWIHHTVKTAGLSLLWSPQRGIAETELPSDWRLRVKTATKRRTELEALEESAPLSEKHRADINAIRKSNYTVIWDDELGCLRTHTCALQGVPHVGFFATVAPGTDPGTPNCFLFPLHESGWRVVRYSPGQTEHDSWVQDGVGWTHCLFNVPCNLETALAHFELVQVKSGYVATFEQLTDIARMMGIEFSPPAVKPRGITIAAHKNGVLARMPFNREDGDELAGWARAGKNWERVIGNRRQSHKFDIVRFLVSEENANLGWCCLIGNRYVDDGQAGALLTPIRFGIPLKADREMYLSQQKQKAYTLVNIPFAPEYPETGQWNRWAAQFKFKAADHDGPTPHFDMVLDHCGKSLTPFVRLDDWCGDRNILSGGDYLLVWAASMFQRPFQLLPYLFFVGPQNAGKSAFPKALGFLMSRGFTKIDKVFKRNTTFDGELAGTILGLVEEATLVGREAYNRIKDLTVTDWLQIEPKGLNSFRQRNCLHFVHTGNNLFDCPILEEDDTRINVIEVGELSEEQQVCEAMMKGYWEQEAPYFIRKLMNYKLPEPTQHDDRLFLPTFWTPAKKKAHYAAVKLDEVPENERKSAALAQEIEPSIRFMASAGWLIRVTTSQILSGLRWLRAPGLPDTPNEIGMALNHLNQEGLEVRSGRSNSTRWKTIATPSALKTAEWCDTLPEDEEDCEPAAHDAGQLRQ